MANDAAEERWRDAAKGFLKAALAGQNLTYADLRDKLAAIGIEDTESGIRNKVSRGAFTAAFLLQCFAALGVELIPFRPGVSITTQLPADMLRRSEQTSR